MEEHAAPGTKRSTVFSYARGSAKVSKRLHRELNDGNQPPEAMKLFTSYTLNPEEGGRFHLINHLSLH